jgi:amino acid permease
MSKNSDSDQDQDVVPEAAAGKAPALVAVEPRPVNHHLIGDSSRNGNGHGLEDGINEADVDDHDGDLVTAAELHDLKRGLTERHLGMLGIAGAIGTGLFLSLGGAIQTGGPLGALLGYAMVGGIVCSVQYALGEVTALLPVSICVPTTGAVPSAWLTCCRSRAASSDMLASL